MYHQAKYKDNTFIRSIVWFMYLFEVLQTVLLTHDTFHQLAVSFGSMEGLGKPYLIGFELPIQSGISRSLAPRPGSSPSPIALQLRASRNASTRGASTCLGIRSGCLA